MKIIEVDNGIANYFYDNKNSWIEINKNLKYYPDLYNHVLLHELQHSKSKNKHIDFMIEFKDLFNLKHNFNLIKFHFKHPKSFTQFLPIVKSHKGEYAKDNFLLLSYFIFFIGIGSVII